MQAFEQYSEDLDAAGPETPLLGVSSQRKRPCPSLLSCRLFPLLFSISTLCLIALAFRDRRLTRDIQAFGPLEAALDHAQAGKLVSASLNRSKT
jgi:hypothetical protein